MTAVSFYITCCLGFIFFAKIEFAVVLFLRRTVNVMSASAKIIKEREEAEAADRAPPPKDDDNEMTDEEDDEDVRNAKKAEEAREGAKTANWTVEDPKDAAADGDKKKTWKEKMEDAKADMDLFNYKMDRIAFFVFLVVFILFNIIFFAIR